MALTALLTSTSVTMTVPDVIAPVILPLSMGIWSATSALFGAFRYPRALESREGMNSGPIRLLAIAPTLFAVRSIVFLDQWVLPVLARSTRTTLLASFLITRTSEMPAALSATGRCLVQVDGPGA